MYTYIHMCIFAYACRCVCKNVHMYMYMCTSKHTCVSDICVYAECTYVCVYTVHVCEYTYLYICIYDVHMCDIFKQVSICMCIYA